VNVAWTVFGQQPAFNAFQDGKVYLAVDTSQATQERLVKDFQTDWEEKARRITKEKGGSTVFPGDKAEWFFMTYAGQTISEQEKLDIKFGRNMDIYNRSGSVRGPFGST
jgi:hypothetical protein